MITFDKPFVFVDVETCKDEEGNHRIVEIAAVKTGKNVEDVQDHFYAVVNPQCDITEEYVKIHGITNERVADQLGWDLIGKEFAAWAGYRRYRLAGWGMHFDVNVIRSEYKRVNIEWPFMGVVMDVKSIALWYLNYMGYRPKNDGWPLKYVCERLELPTGWDEHSAKNDVMATVDLMTYICRKQIA